MSGEASGFSSRRGRSIPVGKISAAKVQERYRSGHNGTDSKSVEPITGYEGSNPSLSAISDV
jgi:hypothetical protein